MCSEKNLVSCLNNSNFERNVFACGVFACKSHAEISFQRMSAFWVTKSKVSTVRTFWNFQRNVFVCGIFACKHYADISFQRVSAFWVTKVATLSKACPEAEAAIRNKFNSVEKHIDQSSFS